MKIKKYIFVPILVALCIMGYIVRTKPIIETHTWVLSYAQQVEPMILVAHNAAYDFSDDESSFFEPSKPIELICEAKDGKLVLTDKTNGKVYEGTYKITSLGGSGRFGTFNGQMYTVVIEGVEGRANISSPDGRMLFMSIDNYALNFWVE